MSNLTQLESLLFISGDEGISLGEINALTGFLKPAIHDMMDQLAQKYANDPDSALELLVSDDVYRLATKTEVADLVKRYFEAPLSTSLSQASLEVLAIIAYRQPITRIEVDEIRGVQSASTVQKLALRGLITEQGRKDEPGRPKLYGTTQAFLDYFGLNQIEDLPLLPEEAESLDGTGDLFLQAFTDQVQTDSEQMTDDNEETN